jgi:hypothetical protein
MLYQKFSQPLPKSLLTLQRQEIESAKRHLENAIASKVVLWQPRLENKPQQLAYASPADRLFYGGSAGGGKSDLLLGLALTAHRSSIIYRREYGQLKGLIKRSRKIVGSNGRYNSTDKIWAKLPGDRDLEFGGIQREDDVEKFQGRDHDFIGYDELTHFTRSQFDFLCGWCRSHIPNQRTRIVGTGNPPTTVEGQWVIEYWAPWLAPTHELYPHPPGELIWYITVNSKDEIIQVGGDRPEDVERDGELVTPHSRTFIAARLDDNPDLAKGNYRSVLQAMPEPLRSRLLYGSFDIIENDLAWQLLRTNLVEQAMQRWEAVSQPEKGITHLGLDVARGGEDQTVLAPRRDLYFDPLVVFEGKDTPDGQAVARLVYPYCHQDMQINIDGIGVGSAAVDILKPIFTVNSVINSASALDAAGKKLTDRSGLLTFANIRAASYWAIYEALEYGNDLLLPRDAKLKQELCAHRWKVKGDVIHLESKDDVKERIGRSPDRSDAIALAMYAIQPHPLTPADLFRSTRR